MYVIKHEPTWKQRMNTPNIGIWLDMTQIGGRFGKSDESTVVNWSRFIICLALKLCTNFVVVVLCCSTIHFLWWKVSPYYFGSNPNIKKFEQITLKYCEMDTIFPILEVFPKLAVERDIKKIIIKNSNLEVRWFVCIFMQIYMWQTNIEILILKRIYRRDRICFAHLNATKVVNYIGYDPLYL